MFSVKVTAKVQGQSFEGARLVLKLDAPERYMQTILFNGAVVKDSAVYGNFEGDKMNQAAQQIIGEILYQAEGSK